MNSILPYNSPIIEATVAGHDERYHLTTLDFSGVPVLISHKDLPIGQSVRLRILARDVSITLERQSGTSILNIIPAQVEALSEENPAQLMVQLKTGGGSLLSRITRKSASVLQLAPGKPVFAQVKSVAMLG